MNELLERELYRLACGEAKMQPAEPVPVESLIALRLGYLMGTLAKAANEYADRADVNAGGESATRCVDNLARWQRKLQEDWQLFMGLLNED